MCKLNELFQELGISKVRLAKYLGVSRQMVYNYLELNDINKWPKEKKLLLFKLLDIEDGSEETVSGINVTTEYLLDVEVEDITRFEEEFFVFIDTNYPEIPASIAETKVISEEMEDRLKKAIVEFKAQFK